MTLWEIVILMVVASILLVIDSALIASACIGARIHLEKARNDLEMKSTNN